MTFEEAIAQQPQWVQWWLTWLLIGGFVLPLLLLIWRQTRLAAIIILVAGFLAGAATSMLYDMTGYTRLLGVGHIIFWTPLALWLIWLMRRGNLPRPARWVVGITLATILASLAFDYVDAARYLLGERGRMAG